MNLINEYIRIDDELFKLQLDKKKIIREILKESIKSKDFSLLKLNTHKLRKDHWEENMERKKINKEREEVVA